jgi:hypothetical protein
VKLSVPELWMRRAGQDRSDGIRHAKLHEAFSGFIE